MIKKFFLIFSVIGIALILNIFDIRFCPFFNLFNIPCVGCGMTRAVKLIFGGKVIESLKYNILPLPLLIIITIYLILYIINKRKLNKFIDKNKRVIIIIAFFMMIVVWIINIYNPLLY